jgi:RING-type zinc-finger
MEPAASDHDCPVCACLLFEPVTTPCGHSFCRSCLSEVEAVGLGTARCPCCRAQLPEGASKSTSVVLASVLEQMRPEEYAARRLEVQKLETEREEARRHLVSALPAPAAFSLVVAEPVLPGQVLVLALSRPRELVLLHDLFTDVPEPRCIVCVPEPPRTTASRRVGTLCRVASCAPVPGSGGAVRLRLLALRRISLGEPVQAGDNMRDISPFCDEAPESAGLADACRAAQEELEAFAATDARLAAHLVAVRAAAHPLPDIPHASEAALAEAHSLRLCVVLFSQMNGEAKLECLQTRSTARRLELARAAIRQPVQQPAGWFVEPSAGTVAVASATGQGSNCVIS